MGAGTEAPVSVCVACGRGNRGDARFCDSCGAPLGDSTSAPEHGVPVTVGEGRYRVDRLLGEGARKVVYRATDERLGREVAVAVIKTDGLDTFDKALRRIREMKGIASSETSLLLSTYKR